MSLLISNEWSVDPSRYSSGNEVTLKYIDEEDLRSKKARKLTEGERLRQEETDAGPDAEDLMVLRKRRVIDMSSSASTDQQKPKQRTDDKKKILMDGLNRKEVSCEPVRVRREDSPAAKREDFDSQIRAYVVGGRDVLKTWEKTSAVVILLPDSEGEGWRARSIRVLADEIAFYHQAIVMVPDIYRGSCGDGVLPSVLRRSDRIFDDIVSVLRFANIEYEPKSLSLAGVNIGAKFAVDTACDLFDISARATIKLAAGTSVDFSSLLGELKVHRVSPCVVERRRKVLQLEYADEDGSSEDNDESTSKDETTEMSSLKYKRQLERAASRVEELGLLSSYPSLPLATVASLCPVAVLALTPPSLNMSRIRDALRVPTFFAYSEKQKESAKMLHQALLSSAEEILDFSIRVYSSTSSIDFIANPKKDEDRKCAGEAIVLGSFWLDIFARFASDDDMVDGAGETKEDNDGLQLVTANDVKMLDLRESPVASYLHDEDEGRMFINDQLLSDETIRRKLSSS